MTEKHTVEWSGHFEQFGQKTDMTFENMFITGDGQIHGGGKDAVGTFTLKGHISGSGDVQFVKAYPTHSVNYKGKLEDDGAIKGSWEIAGQTGGFEIRMKTKRWIGSHLATGGHSLGDAPAKLVASLDFDPKSIHVRGIGHDEKGSFTIHGVTPVEFNRKVVTLEKIYLNNPKVRIYYAGVIVNQGGQEVIRGTWHLPGAEVGDFTLTKQA